MSWVITGAFGDGIMLRMGFQKMLIHFDQTHIITGAMGMALTEKTVRSGPFLFLGA